jgi:hypothetical protein
MDPICIHKIINSDMLYLPELEPFIGRAAEITIEVLTDPAVRDQFWAEASRFPETEEELEAQKVIFRAWRSDPRFDAYWQVLDGFIETDLATVRKWAGIRAQFPLADYDYDPLRAQEECDMEDAHRRML